MAITALEIKDKTFGTKFRGYDVQEVDEFLDILVDDFEELVRRNREMESEMKSLQEKVDYFSEMKESLSQSVILAQETAEKVKLSANNEAANIVNKAEYEAQQLVTEAKNKANEILRDATDDAKRVAIETEDLKRQSRLFHQRLLAAVEGQLGLANAPEWEELLKPTAVYLQNSDDAFKEVVEKVLDEKVPKSDDASSFDATRQFTPEEMEELQRRVQESNRELEELQKTAEMPIITEGASEVVVENAAPVTSTPEAPVSEPTPVAAAPEIPVTKPVTSTTEAPIIEPVEDSPIDIEPGDTQTFKINFNA